MLCPDNVQILFIYIYIPFANGACRWFFFSVIFVWILLVISTCVFFIFFLLSFVAWLMISASRFVLHGHRYNSFIINILIISACCFDVLWYMLLVVSSRLCSFHKFLLHFFFLCSLCGVDSVLRYISWHGTTARITLNIQNHFRQAAIQIDICMGEKILFLAISCPFFGEFHMIVWNYTRYHYRVRS